MKNIEFSYTRTNDVDDDREQEYLSIIVRIDGKYAGELLVNEDNNEIRNIEIPTEYRGRGLYKMLLTAALQELSELISTDRNKFSNPCYMKWMNTTSLSNTQKVVITLDGEEIFFE